jgi:predicted transcriptional regulator
MFSLMKESHPLTPTKAEMEILQVLWRLGPSTVRQVHEEIGQKTGYTTILKLMQILKDKGLLAREEVGRAHLYKPLVSEKRATGEFLRDLLGRVFGGSSSRLVLQALGAAKPSAAELAEIRKLIDQLEEKQK